MFLIFSADWAGRYYIYTILVLGRIVWSPWSISSNKVSYNPFKCIRHPHGSDRIMWVPLFYSLSKWPFSAFDLYRNDFRSIYKLKTIYTQNENDLYIYRKQFVYRSLSSLPKTIFRFEKVRILNFSASMSTSFHLLIWNHSKLLFVVENFFGTCLASVRSVYIPWFRLCSEPYLVVP